MNYAISAYAILSGFSFYFIYKFLSCIEKKENKPPTFDEQMSSVRSNPGAMKFLKREMIVRGKLENIEKNEGWPNKWNNSTYGRLEGEIASESHAIDCGKYLRNIDDDVIDRLKKEIKATLKEDDVKITNRD